MNLAEAAAGLARKEVEKKQANDDILRLEALTSKGAVALLKVNVIEVFGVSSASNMSFAFEVLPSETLYSDGDVVKLEKNVGEQVEFLLLSKDGKISVECTISSTEGEEEKKAYKGEVMISEIPQDAEVRTDVSTDPISLIDGNINNPTLKLKASIDDLASVISSKRLELEQISQELKEISAQVQEVSRNKQDSPPKKKTLKSTKAKKVTYKDSSSASVPDVKSSDKGSIAATVQSYLNDIAAKSWELGIIIVEKRAVVLFCVAAYAITYYGEYASV